ncbi:ABC transporter permease [Paenibacillus xanthanilyticus]|uniref:ABC transporter permease n=1 Tax=Paenibacillus xanthanilyticus TaxID=1783531 RepID=A0ABV8KDC2_9BACL
MSQTVTNLQPQQAGAAASTSPWLEGWRSFRKNKMALVGLGIIVFFVLVAIAAPLLTSYDYKAQDLMNRLQKPSGDHWFGTDDLGRDIYTRIVYGTRISLWVGISSVIGSIVVGTLLGIAAGYYGRWLDMLISRTFDILLAFPGILLAIAIVAALGPSLQNALVAVAIVNVPVFGRLVRARVLSIKNEEYITAAKALGMKTPRILLHHILPNCMGPVIVQGTLGVATAIIEAAALGFLGMGAQPPDPEWGKMLSDSRQFIANAPWTVIFPGLSIMLTVLGFNLMGDGLRDVLDPRMKS